MLDSLFGCDISGGKWRGKEPIHTRGWTMQEHLLSKRILAFGTTGVRWQCLYDMEYGSARWSKYTDVSEILSVSSNMNCRSCVSSRPNYEVKAPALPSVERIWRNHRDSLEPQYEWNQLRASYIARALSKAEDRLITFLLYHDSLYPLWAVNRTTLRDIGKANCPRTCCGTALICEVIDGEHFLRGRGSLDAAHQVNSLTTPFFSRISTQEKRLRYGAQTLN